MAACAGWNVPCATPRSSRRYVYVFRSKRSDRVKLVWWDGTGICLLAKRLESGQFRWPPVADGAIRLSPSQLATLLEGLDWSRIETRDVVRPSAAS